MDPKDIRKIIKFLHVAENLKKALRYGHTKRVVKDSAADHTWRLSLMVVLFAEKNIDLQKALKISIVHDLPEALAGDVDAYLIHKGMASKDDKKRKELNAMKRFEKMLPKKYGKEIFGLWKEYEDGKTKEARFVKALDKFETILHITRSDLLSVVGPKFHDFSFIAHYGDNAVKNYPKLKGIYVEVKKELKVGYKRAKVKWVNKYG